MPDFQAITIRVLSFAFVAILSILVERLLNIVDFRGGIAYSPVIKRGNLNPAISRYMTYGLTYLEIGILAVAGLGLEYLIIYSLGETFNFIIPIILFFIPTSLFIIILCAPSLKAKKFLLPKKWWEWLVIVIFYSSAGLITWMMLKPI